MARARERPKRSGSPIVGTYGTTWARRSSGASTATTLASANPSRARQSAEDAQAPDVRSDQPGPASPSCPCDHLIAQVASPEGQHPPVGEAILLNVLFLQLTAVRVDELSHEGGVVCIHVRTSESRLKRRRVRAAAARPPELTAATSVGSPTPGCVRCIFAEQLAGLLLRVVGGAPSCSGC